MASLTHRDPALGPPLPNLRAQGLLVHQQFEAVAAARPSAVCLVDDATGAAVAYGQVAQAAAALATSLARLGVGRGQGEAPWWRLPP